MDVVAKVAAEGQSVSAAKPQTVQDRIEVPRGGNIALDISPQLVDGYGREGADLIITLETGEKVRIVNFYADPNQPAHLFLVDEDQQLVAVNLVPQSDGSFSTAYVPTGVESGFAQGGIGGVAAGGGGLLGILGGVAAAGAGLAAAGGGGSDGGTPPPPPPPPPADTTPPAAASNLVINADGTVLTGNAEAGATVQIDTNGDGVVDTAAIANANGTFQIPLNPPLTNGETVRVTVTDAAGNTSPPATVTAPDTTAPQPAEDVTISPDGTVITGTAEPGATVGIDTNGDGIPDQTVTAGDDGSFQVTLDPPLTDGELVGVIVTDPAGNDSTPVVVVAPDLVPTPAAPTIDPSNGSVIGGTAEPGTVVQVTDGAGNVIGTAAVQADGSWSLTPATPVPDGTTITAAAANSEGDFGPSVSIVVDGVAPDAPIVAPTNGAEIVGTAEPGATITVTDGDGNLLGTTTADANGNWAITPPTDLPDGAVITATATDAAGNESLPGSVVVDDSLPSIPTIEPSNGTLLTGTADPGNLITLTDDEGNVLGTVTTDANGNWSFTPATQIPDGTNISAVAEDPSGSQSGPATVTIDGIAPATPSIDPTNGDEISGTAEAGALITVTDEDGNVIGQTTADANGNWSVTPVPTPGDGDTVTATATDPSGNTSGPATAVVDAVAPNAPFIAPSNGEQIVGTAEPGATITLTDGAGNPIGTTIADANGNWSFTPDNPVADGTTVNATATDAAGNVSDPGSVVIDASLPAIPVLEPSNGSEIEGSADPGNTVTLTDGDGNLIGQATVDADGNFSFTPTTPLPDGTVIVAVASDGTGAESAPTSIVVDAVAPAPPSIEPTDGSEIAGMAEAGATIIVTGAGGAPIGYAVADANGNWSVTPAAPLPDGTVVNATATDAAGNISTPATATVDAVAPPAPIVAPSNGDVVSGTAEPGTTITVTDGAGNVLGQTTADANGNWSIDPAAPISDGTTVNAVATDAAGNDSLPGTTVVDAVAPATPTNLVVTADGALLTGNAEPGSQVSIVIDGDTANPIVTQADANGNFSVPLSPALIEGQDLSVTASDAAGNVSDPGIAFAPDLTPPLVTIAETADGYLNGAEAADGIQVNLGISSEARVGDVVNLTFAGQNGYEVTVQHTITAADLAAGNIAVTIEPPAGMADFPEGAASVTASVNGGAESAPVTFTVDTVPPATPVLSLVGNILTISAEPGTTLTVEVNIGGTTATAEVMADNNGLASLNLLTDLDVGLSWDQLLTASVSVTGSDVAGNESNVATVGIGENLPQLVTLGDFGIDVSLLPPVLGISGNAENGSSVRVEVVTPLATAIVEPTVDANGNFTINLLDPDLLSDLGLSVTQILNLGNGIELNIVATDQFGNDSAQYGLSLTGAGLGLNLGEITITGTGGDDILSGRADASETINGGAGSDLILHVGTGDEVAGGTGNDTIQIDQANFVSIDGGDGFDTLLIGGGIDIDYNGVGVGTVTNIERIDLGTGDNGSTLTLTAAEVDAVTDGDNVLQITGEANDTLNVAGAVDTGTTQTIDGIVYDVYTFGNTTLLVEENTVQVAA